MPEQEHDTHATVQVHDWRLQKLEDGQVAISESLTSLHTKIDCLPCPVRAVETKALIGRMVNAEKDIKDLKSARIDWKLVSTILGGIAGMLSLDKLAVLLGLGPKP